MKWVYIFSYPGVWLTGYILVTAESTEEAINQAVELVECSRQDIELIKAIDTIEGAAFVIWDGSY